MQATDPYDELITKINNWPIRVPRTKTLTKILKEIFTSEEAYLLSLFDAPNRGSLSVDDIMERNTDPSLTAEKVTKILDSIYQRGLMPRFVHRKTNKNHYLLLPMVIGIFEFTLSNHTIYDEVMMKKLTKLFDKYYYEGFGLEIGASNYPWARVFPHDRKIKQEVIKVDQPIEGRNEILPHDKVLTIIERAQICGVMPCACRVEHKYVGKECKHPVDVCMVFDPYLIEIGMAKEITKEEAIEVLHRTEKEGLVHMSNNSQKGHHFICNCCSCSCGIMGGLTRLGNPHAFAKSNFITVIDESAKCTKCYKCVEICPLHAIQHWIPHEEADEIWKIDEEKCIGCGVCASNCPTNRMTLQKIKNDIIEETIPESYMRMETERFH
ncbi:MAG: 4Fe-4S dicluster domain-containing protein [Candidatus Hodarchaeales archaeon]|jgi:Pyruvate/2-oxoacid:ferredoxin oxidoreductase delta subunit